MGSPFNAYRRSQRANRFYANPCMVLVVPDAPNSLTVSFDRPVGLGMAGMFENFVAYDDAKSKLDSGLAVVSVEQIDDFTLSVLMDGATALVESAAFVGESPGMQLQAVGYAGL